MIRIPRSYDAYDGNDKQELWTPFRNGTNVGFERLLRRVPLSDQLNCSWELVKFSIFVYNIVSS